MERFSNLEYSGQLLIVMEKQRIIITIMKKTNCIREHFHKDCHQSRTVCASVGSETRNMAGF